MGFLFRKGKRDEKAAADEFYTKGQWSQALDAYRRVCERDPGNVKLLRRVADLLARLGRKEEAVETYRRVAETYAQGGFLVQAIAIQKIVLRLDPSAADVGRNLTSLYAKRGMGPRVASSERRALPEIPLFSDLDPDAFAQVVERLVPRSLAMGEFLFHQGDPGDSIFIVTSGTVRISRGDLTLAELAEGAFFGEGAFFSHEPRNADVVAVAPAELLEIRREDTEGLLSRHPGVANALSAFYRRRVLDGILAASPFFGLLPEGERKTLADRLQLVRVEPGEVVVREGDTDRSLYLVKRGAFRVTARTPGQAEPAVLAELGAGSLFGEVALVSEAPRTATVSALEEGEVLRAGEADLRPVLERHPELRRALEKLRDDRAAATIAKILGRDP
jgi:cAMP-dependent protein kinase regulator